MKRLFAPGQFTPLLLALVVFFILYPLLLDYGRVRLLRIAFISVLVLAVYTQVETRRRLVLASLLAAPTAAGQMMQHFWPERLTLLVAVSMGLIFLTYTTIAVLLSVLKPGRITADRIAGAVSVYLLLGLAWSLAFGICAILVPGAFVLPDEIPLKPGSDPAAEYAFIYYSFTTLTTLGYGDITPIKPFAQTLAWMEAVTGQLFLAILIARLVGLHIVHGRGSE